MKKDFIFIEYRNKEFYCFKFKDVKRCKAVEDIIKDEFTEYLHDKTHKKHYIETLSYVFTNLFMAIKDVELSYNDDLMLHGDYVYYDPMMKDCGYTLKYSYHNGNLSYRYGSVSISNKFMADVIKFLECIDLMKHEEGRIYPTYKPSFEYINWIQIYKIYEKHRDNILKYIDKATLKKNSSSKVVIKEKNNEGELVEIEDKARIKSLSRRTEIKDSNEYIKQLRKMYSEMNYHIGYFDEGTDIQRKNILNIYKEKYGDIFNEETFNKNVDIRNRYLKNTFMPYRTFHLYEKNLTWGRIYNSPLDSYVSNIYKPLLKINGEYALSIDIKSALIQLYILKEHPEIDNRQDFYRYDGLDIYSLKRNDVKFISQCLLYNRGILNAWRAYNYNSVMNKEYTKLSYEMFKSVIEIMKNEKEYLFKDLYGNLDKCKSLIHEESRFMIEVSKELMKNSILHIYNFDALYVSYRNILTTIETFKEVSIGMYKRSINVEHDEELRNELYNT